MNNSFKFTNEPTAIIHSWIKSYVDFCHEDCDCPDCYHFSGYYASIIEKAVNGSLKEFEDETAVMILNSIPQKQENNKWQHRINAIVDELFFHSFYMVDWKQLKEVLAEEAE